MKKYLIITISLLLLIPEGCKKYEDGPWISFRSPQARLISKKPWILYSYQKNEKELINEYNDSCGCSFTYSRGQDQPDPVLLKCNGFSITGIYNFKNNNNDFSIYEDSVYNPNFKYKTPLLTKTGTTWGIIKLTNKDFIIKTTYNNENYVVKMSNIK